MPKDTVKVDEDNKVVAYNLYYAKGIKHYCLKCPRILFQRLNVTNADTFDICIDEEQNIYLCRQFDLCVFCGKQSKDSINGKPICRSCMKRLKSKQFDEVIKNVKVETD